MFNVEKFLDDVSGLRGLSWEIRKRAEEDKPWGEEEIYLSNETINKTLDAEELLADLLFELECFGEELLELERLQRIAPETDKETIEYREVCDDYKDELAKIQQAIREAQYDQEKQVA